MNWQARDKYHMVSDPPGYNIAIYHHEAHRDVVAYKGSVELAHRNGITTEGQYEAAKAELKAICEADSNAH